MKHPSTAFPHDSRLVAPGAASRRCYGLLSLALLFSLTTAAFSDELTSSSAALFLDFEKPHPHLELFHGAKLVAGELGSDLEFDQPLQYAEFKAPDTLNGIEAMSIGGWFFPRRTGEQYFFARGQPQTGPQGERFFRPQPDWVNWVLGMDQRGFLLGTIHGNGSMPFAQVTISEVGFDTWNQLVVTKDRRGFHRFYHNGILVHSDVHALGGGKVWPFHDRVAGEPIRLAMPLGGRIGEVWVYPRELAAEEIRHDFEAKRARYKPALTAGRVQLREMNAHYAAGLWREPLVADRWPALREDLARRALEILGPPPTEKVPLDSQDISEVDCGTYRRRKISLQVQPDDRMPAYLLVPKNRLGRVPAIICFYGTTSGAGKDTTVGISGRQPGSAPHPNLAFAVDLVEAGFVAFAADYLRDGERIEPGRQPYDTTSFYNRFPEWSVHGKDAWDTSRAIDYLQTLDFVDAERIGMVGHSYGGHSTIFTTALEPRIKVAVANGPVSDFLHHGTHWGVPKGAGNSQSMPRLRPYVLDHTLPLPITFYEFTSLIAPRPLLVGQAAGERRPREEENHAAVSQVYRALGHSERLRYVWYAGDHDFPPEMRQAAVAWFRQWFK